MERSFVIFEEKKKMESPSLPFPPVTVECYLPTSQKPKKKRKTSSFPIFLRLFILQTSIILKLLRTKQKQQFESNLNNSGTSKYSTFERVEKLRCQMEKFPLPSPFSLLFPPLSLLIRILNVFPLLCDEDGKDYSSETCQTKVKNCD